MLIKYQGNGLCQDLISKYTVPNEDYKRKERILKKPCPRLKYVHLYTRTGKDIYYFPVADEIAKKKFPLALKFQWKWNPDIELRDEQAYIIKKIDKIRCGLIEMKTGAGKSLTIAKATQLWGRKTLIATHSLLCLKDMKKTFKRALGIDIGEYSAKKKNIQTITVTTHKSLVDKYEEFAGQFDIVIIDECDRNLTDNMFEALNMLDIEGIYGFTGTPRTKELSLESMQKIFGPHIKADIVDNNGYQLLPDIWTFKYKTGMEYPYTQWHELKEMLVGDSIRFKMQCQLIYNAFKKGYLKYGLLLVERKEEECVQYYNYFTENTDLPVIYINGDTKVEDDNKNIEYIKKHGKGLVVGTVGKVGRGADIPMIDGVFLFFPNRFESSTIQAVGRGLRKCEGKDKCILFDRVDFPVLRSQMYERQRTYKKEYGQKPSKIYDIDVTKIYQKMSSQTL